jgi:lambda family phage portal protein
MIKRIKQAFAYLFRGYASAEPSKVNATRKPHNRTADQEALPPFGADSLRAYARDLVRNNAYASGVVETIVSSVVGTGIKTMSNLETQDGEDVELLNEFRDNLWERWCEVAELTGQYTWCEVQAIAQREIVEAGEVLIHLVNVPLEYRGIKRPVPFAIELIEADRLATDRDTFIFAKNDERRRIIRGVELDEIGKPVAYWIYPAHPNDIYNVRREPVRIEAENILHLYKRQRVGQNRGVTWFAPVVNWLRDMGLYVDNEMQAGAVSSCLTAFVKTDTPMQGLMPPNGMQQNDNAGNQYDYLEPGAIFRLNPGEDLAMVNPLRPNSNAEPWLQLMLRGIAVGTGLSYEVVARDYSQTNYSSSRTSQLEDRRRFRMWQNYLINHLCDPVWKKFCQSASLTGLVSFPTMEQLDRNIDRYAPAQHMPPTWEWVDPQAEQAAAEKAITSFQASYSEELGALGKNWRHVFYQRAKEEALLKKLGLISPMQQAEALAAAQSANAEAIKVQAEKAGVEIEERSSGSGEMMGLSRLQWQRNRKAIMDVIGDLSEEKISKTQAKVLLSSLGISSENIEMLLEDLEDERLEIIE